MERIPSAEGLSEIAWGYSRKPDERSQECAMLRVTRAYDVTAEVQFAILERDWRERVTNLVDARLYFCTLVGRIFVFFTAYDGGGRLFQHSFQFWLDDPSLDETPGERLRISPNDFMYSVDLQRNIVPVALAVACRDEVLNVYLPPELVANPPPLEKYVVPAASGSDPD